MAIDKVYQVADTKDVAGVNKTLDSIYQQATGSILTDTIPTVNDVPLGKVVIYDNGADQTAVFTGSGLNDCTSGGVYTGASDIEYSVVIDATGTPDTFQWLKDSVSQATGVAITGSAQTLDNGITVTFGATTGHTVSDSWTINPAIRRIYFRTGKDAVGYFTLTMI